MKSKYKKRISILLVIIWMILIFTMSSFSSTESNNQSNFIIDIIANIFNINNIDNLNLIIRKLAHFTEYFILGVLVYNMTYNYNKKTFIAIIICVLYAISDEFHQMIVPGRSCQLLDITIDSSGSITGIYIIKTFINNLKKTRKII